MHPDPLLELQVAIIRRQGVYLIPYLIHLRKEVMSVKALLSPCFLLWLGLKPHRHSYLCEVVDQAFRSPNPLTYDCHLHSQRFLLKGEIDLRNLVSNL